MTEKFEVTDLIEQITGIIEELEYEINTRPGNGEIFREYLTESTRYLESSIKSLEKAVKTFD